MFRSENEEEIIDLNNIIKRYENLLEKAINDLDEIREERYAGLVKSARDNLNNLLSKQHEERQFQLSQSSVQQGKKVPSFEEILRERVPNIKPGVVARCRRRFGSLVQQAVIENSSEVAQMAYEQAEALPQTNTEIQFQIEGILLNGLWNNREEKILICYQDTLVKLLKVLTSKEMERASVFLAKLQGQPLIEFITPFELRSMNQKNFMIMPYYSSTLEYHPKLSISSGVKLFQQISQAIIFFHNLGLNHMDIKPSNVCLRENGNFVLIDLGSVVMKGSSSESTVVYIPRDFQPRDPCNLSNKYKAVDLNDWLMLGMTIAEKVYGLVVGEDSTQPPTIQELINILQPDGVFDELISILSNTDHGI